jgi:hypothetical protein
MKGSDDAFHIKASLLGASVQIPITNGRLSLEYGKEYICVSIEIMPLALGFNHNPELKYTGFI